MRRMMAVMLLLGTAQFIGAHVPDSKKQNNGQRTKIDTVLIRANESKEDVVSGSAETRVVSVAQLRIPEKAAKELDRSDEDLRVGNVRASAAHIERAVRIAPNLALAHNALGARYAQLDDDQRAMEEFRKALEIDRNYRLAADNLAMVLCLERRYAEAEPIARRALEIEPDALSSQYLLGSILVEERKNGEEAGTLLENVKEKYPRAWLFLAKIAIAKGDMGRATEAMQAYLRSPSAMENEKKIAQNWLWSQERRIEAQRNSERVGPGTSD